MFNYQKQLDKTRSGHLNRKTIESNAKESI